MNLRRRVFGRPWGITVVCAAAAIVASPARADPEATAAGQAAMKRGDRAEAIRQFEKAYRAYDAALGPRHADTIDSMRDLAAAYRASGRPAEALPLAEAAARLQAEILGERHEDTLDSQGDVASLYGQLGRYAEQAALNEKVLRLRTEVLGARHPATLSSMSNVGLAYSNLGRHAEALAVGEQVVALCIEVFGESHASTLSTMNNLANTYGLVGRHADQAALNEKVLRLRTQVLGPIHPRTLTSMGNLAYSYFTLGRHAEALALNEQVLKLRTEVLGPRHPDTLFVMNNLAQSYVAMGRYADALALVERVLPLRTEVLGPRHPDTIVSINDLARLHYLLGRYPESIVLYEKGLAAHRASAGERHPNTLVVMTNLARAYRAVGRDDDALALTESASRLQSETLGERHPRTLTSIGHLGSLYRQRGRIGDALALEERLVKLQAEVVGAEHPDTLASLAELSQTYAVSGRRDDGIALGESVLAVRTRTLGERHPDTLQSLAFLELQFAEADRHRDAAALAERYVAGAEWQRAQPGLSSEDRRSVFQGYAQTYRRFSIDSGRSSATAQGFRLAELSKARTLLDSMTAQRAGSSGALPAPEQAALDDLSRQIAAHAELIAQARTDEARLNLEAARNVLVRRADAMEAELKARFPRYAQLREPKVLDAAELRGVVPADAIAISYVVANDGTAAAWLVGADGRPGFVSLGRLDHLDDAVETLRRASSRARGLTALLEEDAQRAWRMPDGTYRLLDASAPPPASAVAVADAAEVAAYLSRVLLAPLEPALRGRRQWIVSPDGPLAQLPFELLSAERRRVLDGVELHYAQSLSVYALARARQRDYRSLRRPLDLLAVGDPVYGTTAPANGVRRATLRSAAWVSEDQLRSGRLAWPALPGTAVEIAAIRRLFPHGDALLHADASEAHLQRINRSGELQRYRILHFAVHGNLSSRDPALSSLVLSQKALAPGTDGYITAAEWPGYDLRSDLTVLSACETGLGANLSGEGVMGLPFALFLAGNVNTVLSLWPVEDRTAPRFMRRFYAHLKAGDPAARALTKTKREMAADPATRHPSHWAAFTLVGAG